MNNPILNTVWRKTDTDGETIRFVLTNNTINVSYEDTIADEEYHTTTNNSENGWEHSVEWDDGCVSLFYTELDRNNTLRLMEMMDDDLCIWENTANNNAAEC
tara:strand:+ start:1054 stop:1359 length:306 start_codon:yes stop_codon:yes gene_type:complete